MRRDDLDPTTRAVSDTLDELLWRHFEIATSWSNPESFIEWLAGRGYVAVAAPVPHPAATDLSEGGGRRG